MPDSVRPELDQAPDHNSVHLAVRAGGSMLDLAVVIENSILELPRDHVRVWFDRVPTRTPRECRGFEAAQSNGAHFYVYQVDRRIEFGAYWTTGERHDNPLAQELLNCFEVADRVRINQALTKLANYRESWWNEALAQRAATLGKTVAELTDKDKRPLMTGSGHREYPESDTSSDYNCQPAFQVNRDHLEAQLQLLLARLLDEAVPAA